MAAWAVAAAHVVFVAQVAGSGLDIKTLVAALAAAEVPIAIGAALVASGCAHWRARQEVELGDQRRLAARVDLAERALAHTQERTHEPRATLGGLRLSNELLVGRRAAVSRETRRRLQRLHTAEPARVERLLAARPAVAATAVDLVTVLDPLVDVMALKGRDVRWRGTRPYVRARAVRVRDGSPGVPRELTPARRLAQELGGDLRPRPQHPGHGAEFVLRLPEATGEAPCLAAAV